MITPVWIAFIRGINVGGHRKVKMAELHDAMTKAGLGEVKTYIQSGNCAFRSDKAARELSDLIQKILVDKFNCDVPVVVLSETQIAKMHEGNPFEGDPSRIMFFMTLEPLPLDFDHAKLTDLLGKDEELQITQDTIYLNAPEGFSRSKLAEKLPKLVPVEVTARNLRTIETMKALAAEITETRS